MDKIRQCVLQLCASRDCIVTVSGLRSQENESVCLTVTTRCEARTCDWMVLHRLLLLLLLLLLRGFDRDIVSTLCSAATAAVVRAAPRRVACSARSPPHRRHPCKDSMSKGLVVKLTSYSEREDPCFTRCTHFPTSITNAATRAYLLW